VVRLDRHHRAYEISYSVESYEFLTVPQQERVFDFKRANACKCDCAGFEWL
jgi:hypothetical protein